jgi:Uma2 family endonuclease
MSAVEEVIDAPLDREQLGKRWQALCADPSFEDIPAKIELTEWGEILMSPVGKTHGATAAHMVEVLRNALGGRAMVEVGVATTIGVRAPDVAWCSQAYFDRHPEEAPLSEAPELCIEIASASDALPKLREKASAYIGAGATEAWIVFPKSRQIEIYGAQGRRDDSAFAVDLDAIFL